MPKKYRKKPVVVEAIKFVTWLVLLATKLLDVMTAPRSSRK